MEFPSTGERCSNKECKQLDFLPFICTHCSQLFCKEHFHVLSHSCSEFKDNVANSTEKFEAFSCSQESCLNKSTVKLPCPKCQKHFCISHRHHTCFELKPEKKINQPENWKQIEEKFSETKTAIDQAISTKLKKSKNHDMANKIRIMKLKSKSSGPKQIPQSERFYFAVYPPVTDGSKTYTNFQGIFVSTYWSIGKIIDFMAELLKLPNYNNDAKSKKLRLFNHETGKIIATKIDTTLSELIKSDSISEGQDIILEYVDDEKMDVSLYDY